MEIHDENVHINCNMTMREIVDIFESPYLPEDLTLYDLLSGKEELSCVLLTRILGALVRHSILFVCFKLSIAYVGVILEGGEAASSYPSVFEFVGVP